MSRGLVDEEARLTVHLSDVCAKSIAQSGQSFDQFRSVGIQELPQPRDVLGDVAFFYERLLPKSGHHLLFGYQQPVVLNKQHECLKDLIADMERFAASKQNTLSGVERKSAENIDNPFVFYRFVHRPKNVRTLS